MNSLKQKIKEVESNGVSLSNITLIISQTDNTSLNNNIFKIQPKIESLSTSLSKVNHDFVSSEMKEKKNKITFKQDGFITIIPIENWKKYNIAQRVDDSSDYTEDVKCTCLIN